MRTIKFRSWDTETKEMTYYHPLSETEHGSSLACHELEDSQENYIDTWTTKPSKSFILMQYTGINDDDGLLIYEGGIVHYEFEDVGSGDHDCGVAEVQYSEFSAGFQLVNSECAQEFWDDKELWSFEVVGNRYQNPELLEEVYENPELI